MKLFIRILVTCLLFGLFLSACSTFDEKPQPEEKRVLFCGDSITRGELGCSFTELLKARFPEYAMINLGLDGDTVSGIMNRTLAHLEKDDDYDLIVISAGHNDILLPAFRKLSPAYRSIVTLKKLQGSVPAENYPDFIFSYETFIDSVMEISDAPVVLVTLSCINEDLQAPTNLERQVYNRGIIKLAADKNTYLADAGRVFDDQLVNCDCRDYLMSDLLESAFSDRRRSRTAAGCDKLGTGRGLHLTIDGVHLNSTGAEIYCKALYPFLENL